MTNKLVILLPIVIALFLLFSMVSISIAQICLALAFLIWLFLLIKREKRFLFPAFFWGIIVYSAFSLISSIFSVNPEISLGASKQLLYFLVVPIIYTGFFQKRTAVLVNHALLVSGFVSCLYSLFIFVFKAAPGERILSLVPTWYWEPGAFPYAFGSGTSASTPHVAGLAALMVGLKPWLSVSEIMDIIRYSADDVNSADHPGQDEFIGYGRINMEKASVPIKITTSSKSYRSP